MTEADKRCERCGRELTDGLCVPCGLKLVLQSDTPPPTGERLPYEGEYELLEPIEVGDYTLLGKIADGGMGVVYRARQVSLNRTVAVKILLGGVHATPELKTRFRREAEAVAKLQHPGIVTIYEVGEHEGSPYFAMEYVDGQDLRKLIRERPLEAAKAAGYMRLVAEAVHYAHGQGILHRDLKPSNILVDPFDLPRVTDFGLAKGLAAGEPEGEPVTATGQALGTPGFAPPEQVSRRFGPVGVWSDVYGLGATLYSLLTGRPPFLAASMAATERQIEEAEPVPVRGLNASVPADLETICLKCLEKEPRRRYATAKEVAEELARFLAGEPILARPASPLERGWKWAKRRPVVAALSAGLALAVLGGLAGVTWQWRRAEQHAAAETVQRARAEASAEAEAEQRRDAHQRLYDTLIHQAHATRLARQTGYRERVLALLTSAQALDVPQRRSADIRCEAVGCFGDFVGLDTIRLAHLPEGLDVSSPMLSPQGDLVAFRLSGNSLLLATTASGDVLANMTSKGPIAAFSFNSRGTRITTVQGFVDRFDQLGQTYLCSWTSGLDHQWTLAQRDAFPGAFACFRTEHEPMIARAATNSIDLTDSTGRILWSHPWNVERHGLPHLALSHNGRFLALAQATGPHTAVLALGDLDSGRVTQTHETNASDICDMGVTSGGHIIRTSTAGCFIDGPGMPDLRRVAHLGGYFYPNARFAICPDREVVALPITLQHGISLWDIARYQELGRISVPDAPWLLTCSADGTLLLAVGGGGARTCRLKLLDERVDLDGHQAGADGISFSPDASTLASASRDRSLKVWDVRTGRLRWSRPLPAQGFALAYSPDGRFIATSYWGLQMVSIWDAERGEVLKELGSTTSEGIMWSVHFTPDGRSVVGGGGEGQLEGLLMWPLHLPFNSVPTDDVSDVMARALPVAGGVWGLALAPNGRRAAFVPHGKPGEVYLWDMASPEKAHRVYRTVNRGAQVMAFLPDGRQIVLIDRDRRVVVVDAETGKTLHSFSSIRTSVSGEVAEEQRLSLSPDGSTLALSTPSNMGVDLWDVRRGEFLYSLPESNSDIWRLAWAGNGRSLAVTKAQGQITVWHIDSVMAFLKSAGFSPTLTRDPYDVPEAIRLGWRGLDLVDQQRWEDSVAPLSQAIAAVENDSDGELGILISARARAFDSLGRGAEAMNERKRTRSLPALHRRPSPVILLPRPAGLDSNLLDLSEVYNASLDEDFHRGGLLLSSVPRGKQRFAGVDFDIRGIVQVTSVALERQRPGYPEQVAGIPLNQRADELCCLLGTGWPDARGTTIGRLLVMYADQAVAEVEIVYGIDLVNWEFFPGETEDGEPKPAWRGPHANRPESWPNAGVRLFVKRWENPHPEKIISSVSFCSGMRTSAPFLVAITVEGRVQARDDSQLPTAPLTPVVLSGHFNGRFEDAWQNPADVGNTLSSLPTGLQTLGRCIFEIRGIIQLSSSELVKLVPDYPEKTPSVPVKQKGRALHFLEGCGWREDDGTTVAKYVLHYADGQTAEIPVVYGRDLRNWQFWPEGVAAEKGGPEPVWKGPQERWKAHWPDWGVRLYEQTWVNPRPDVEIDSLDLESTMGKCAVFVIAITVEP